MTQIIQQARVILRTPLDVCNVNVVLVVTHDVNRNIVALNGLPKPLHPITQDTKDNYDSNIADIVCPGHNSRHNDTLDICYLYDVSYDNS